MSRRENHDAAAFYDRFRPPLLSSDEQVAPPLPVAEPFLCADARTMAEVADNSVALVVTSPPYFAGKTYEEEVEREGVPASYLEYLALLGAVFTECARVLEPGGRIAVNVANLGRKPYRSLSADVIRILQDDLGLLLRGELIWQKGEGASGNCAWGSFRSASNPVLRDITERVVVASKGRFDRALGGKRRREQGLPSESTLMAEDFMALTLDLWSIPPESARRVGHPAPFPVELPEQLIRLYTFAGDLVLDPFMGAGSTLVAAARLRRRYVGYDTDASYVETARRRVAALAAAGGSADGLAAEARREGRSAEQLAAAVLDGAGFTVTATDHLVAKSGVRISFAARDAAGEEFLFDVVGAFVSHRGGLARNDAVWRALGRAAAVRGRSEAPLVLLTTELPKRPGPGDAALRSAGPSVVFDLVDLLDPAARERLARYAKGGQGAEPLPGFWGAGELT
ncbi:MAG TPA: site-specific DNA-methyltransferase [Acidimicrobiales bacterium]|nr:site-specific DNA-methyltransferase [Acidimicrobiales bacterium]